MSDNFRTISDQGTSRSSAAGNGSAASGDNDVTVPEMRYRSSSAGVRSAYSGDTDVTVPETGLRSHRLSAGDVLLGRYRILSVLGQGGMGVVYRCLDETAGIEVALKALPPELSHNTTEMEDVRENFQLVAKLVHQNIAISKTIERDSATGDCYLIMECAEGEDLKHWLRRRRGADGAPIPLSEALPILRQTAEALDYAHSERIMHRDIKPGNIMVSPEGRVKVLDFGLAAQIHTSLTRVSLAYHGTSGTSAYMSPEQWEGRIQGAAADQYALGVVAYEMLSGHLPFDGSDIMILREAVLHSAPLEITSLPQAVNAALARALAKSPQERFPSCVAFVDALEGKKSAGKQLSSRKLFFAMAAVFLFALLGMGGFLLSGRRSPQPAPAPVEQPETRPVVTGRSETLKAPPADTLQLEQETYEMQASLRNLKPQIDQAGYDRGQTFGEHLDALNRNYSSAEGVMKETENANRFARAHEWYGRALEECRWIQANAPLRQEASAAIAAAETAREKALSEGAETLGRVEFARGDSAVAAAKASYDVGDFAAAQEKLQSASAAFGVAFSTALATNVRNLLDAGRLALQAKKWPAALESAEKALVKDASNAEARQLKSDAESGARTENIDGHLAAARKAFGEKRWEETVSFADEVLKLDSANVEARQLKSDAEYQMKPWLGVVAQVEGKVVSATVTYDPAFLSKREDDTEVELEKGKKYHLSVKHESNGESWTGELDVTADWGGLREKTLELKKVAFNGIVTLPGDVKLELIKVKAGTFMMGSPEGEKGRASDETLHQVTLTRDYWLGKYEVTQEQWKAVMGTEPSFFKGARRPVERVSWYDAQKFCEKLNELNAGKLPAGYRFSLPTEAQWEYACRAGTTTAYSFGNSCNGREANCNGNYPCGTTVKGPYKEETCDVGSYAPNPWGFHDMHGNVREWCQDWYGTYPGGPQTDPTGPAAGSGRLLRGGGWYYSANYCRSAYRSYDGPSSYGYSGGFRVACWPVVQ